MIKIAVADDDRIVCQELKLLIDKFAVKYDYNIVCSVFDSCEAFVESIEKGEEYKLVFLDIEFPEMSGIELSQKIRNYYRDMKMQIVFISAKQDYAMELFDIQPFNFLLKPLSDERVYTCLSKYMTFYNQSHRFFEYTYENTKYRIALNEIIYLESHGKKIQMHTHDRVIEFYGVFSETAEKLRQQFVVVKRGVMVNIQHIRKSTFLDLELVNGEKIKVSRNYREDVRNRIALDSII